MVVSPEILKRLQTTPDLVRNICILAHVDHGKTTLSDSLLASNGIISQNQAGKLRYLDSRPDEQARGITMESSAVSLYFKVARKPLIEGDKPQIKEYLINLIDSPGHIDFSSEVSTASRLCDGALVLVDVVEGVCSQTVNVLRQAWIEKLKPILVINKMDRLIHELQLTPMEAYTHLTRLIEQVNAIMGSFFANERMEDDMKWREQQELASDSNEYVEKSDEDLYFSPEKNNVIFASAIDGWGFNVSQFAAIYERKLGIKREKLEKVLWGDFYFDAKTKKVVGPKHKSKNARPLFVQLVLETIWAVYDSTVVNRDAEKSAKIVAALNLKVNPRDFNAKDGQFLLASIFGQWIPLSVSVLLSVIDRIPSPLAAQAERLPPILDSVIGGKSLKPVVRTAMIDCDRNGPTTAYISKVIAVPEEELLRKTEETTKLTSIQERTRRARELASSINQNNSDVVAAGGDGYEADYGDDDDFDFEALKAAAKKEVAPVREKLIGFSRVFSGTLKVGQELLILQPKYDPQFPDKHCEKVTITDLYLLMGRELINLKEVPAGNIVGIGGLDGKIFKNGTLVSPKYGGPNLASLSNVSAPIVRVAVEPVDPTKLDQLEQGLRLLNLSDPMVQVTVQENGEHILMTAGELHLERCLKDLRERFAKVEIQASKPIVPFRESIVVPKEKTANPRGMVDITNEHLSVKFRIEPLPVEVTKFLNENAARIERLVTSHRNGRAEDETATNEIIDKEGWDSLKRDLAAVYKKSTIKVTDGLFGTSEDKNAVIDKIVNSVVTFGPRRTGPNLLIDPNNTLSRKV